MTYFPILSSLLALGLEQDLICTTASLSIRNLKSYNHILSMLGFLRAVFFNRSTLNLAAPRHFLVGQRRMSVRPMIPDGSTSPTRESILALP